MISTVLLHAAHLVPAAVPNPLDGVLPDFSIFGLQFTTLWQKALGGLWAIAIIVSVVYLILGVAAMATASGPNANPMAHAEGRKKFVNALIALGILAALAIIVGAVLAFVG